MEKSHFIDNFETYEKIMAKYEYNFAELSKHLRQSLKFNIWEYGNFFQKSAFFKSCLILVFSNFNVIIATYLTYCLKFEQNNDSSIIYFHLLMLKYFHKEKNVYKN